MILLCRIVWASSYSSRNEKFDPGGFSYPAEHGEAGELLNFAPFGQKLYGYMEGRGANIRLENLGAKPSDEKLDGVTVIWCARSKELDRLLVVGWYINATVFRELQLPNKPLKAVRKNWGYYVSADKDNCYIIPQNLRTIEVPTKKNISDKGFIGQKSWFYPLRSDNYRDFLDAFSSEIQGNSQYSSDLERSSAQNLFQEGQRQLREFLLPVRNAKLVAAAKRKYGYNCAVCNFNFEKHFGEIGRYFIEVHHIDPLSSISGKISTDIKDVCVLCSNCHRMIHRKSPPFSPEELRALRNQGS